MDRQLVHTAIRSAAMGNPLRPAIRCPERTFTNDDMLRGIDAIAELLIVEGIRKGDPVLVRIGDPALFLLSVYAVMRAGAVAVPLSAETPGPRVAAVARRCTPEALLTTRHDLTLHPVLGDLLHCPFMHADAALGERREESEPSGRLDEPAAGGIDRITTMMDIGGDDEALLCFPAEEEGEPAVVTHGQLVYAARFAGERERLTAADTEYIASPFWELPAIQRAVCLHAAGGSVETGSVPGSVTGLPEALLRQSSNGFFITSDELAVLLETGADTFTPCRTSAVRIDIGICTAPTDARALRGMFPEAEIYLHRDYPGVPYATFLHLNEEPQKFETVGKATGNLQLNIRNEQGCLVSRPYYGEVVIRIPGQPGAPGRRRRNSLPPQWHGTGDIGYLDRDGYLHIIAQQFETISVNGLRYSPLIMEEMVRSVFSDCEIGIVGVPDPTGELGEIPVFCYHPSNGTKITSADLTALLSKDFAQYQIPRIICRTAAFPRRGTVLMRRELRMRVQQALSQSEQKMR